MIFLPNPKNRELAKSAFADWTRSGVGREEIARTTPQPRKQCLPSQEESMKIWQSFFTFFWRGVNCFESIDTFSMLHTELEFTMFEVISTKLGAGFSQVTVPIWHRLLCMTVNKAEKWLKSIVSGFNCGWVEGLLPGLLQRNQLIAGCAEILFKTVAEIFPKRCRNTKFYRTFLSGSNHIAQSRRQANSGHVQGNNTEAAPLMTRLSDKVTEDGIGCSCNQRKDREDKNNSSLCTSCAWTPICCTPKQK